MKLTMVGRQMDITSDLKELFENKLKKFDKFFKDEAEATVTLSKRKNTERVELTIFSNGTIFRAEESNSTFQNALDRVMDSIVRQIRKNKTRLEKRLRDGVFKGGYPDAFSEAIEEENEFEVRTKRFNIKPMSVEEAILQMNLLEHQFFVFRDTVTEEINVVYKRFDGGYGLIVPEC